MKYVLYTGLLLALVPIQTTVLDYASVVGIRPDLPLVAAVLIGMAMGPFEGLFMGLALGVVQDFFSAGQLGLNLTSKGLAGLFAGVASRYVASATPLTVLALVLTLSSVSGLIFLFSGQVGDESWDWLYGLSFVLVPQALYDAALAATIYWMIEWKLRRMVIDETGWSH